MLGLRPFLMQYTSTVADHYLYLPMLGVALALAQAGADVAATFHSNGAGARQLSAEVERVKCGDDAMRERPAHAAAIDAAHLHDFAWTHRKRV